MKRSTAVMALSLLFCLPVAFLQAQDKDGDTNRATTPRTDAEIRAGLEVYVANMDAAYVTLREERDALKARVEELEKALESEKN